MLIHIVKVFDYNFKKNFQMFIWGIKKLKL